ncbi:AI-2E family transporter [bacterium]|nr:AI-2E family transporter [bacterium]
METLRRKPIPFARIVIPVVLILLGIWVLFKVFPRISDLVIVLIITVVLTYLFKPIVQKLEHLGLERLPAIGVLYLGIAVILVGLGMLMAPIISNEVSTLMESFVPPADTTAVVAEGNAGEPRTPVEGMQEGAKAPTEGDPGSSSTQATGKLEEMYLQYSGFMYDSMPSVASSLGIVPGTEGAQLFADRISEYLSGFLGKSSQFIAGLFNAFALSTVIPFLLFFFLKDGDKGAKLLIQKVPNRYFEMTLSLMYNVDKSLGNYISSILVESTIIAILSWPAFALLGLKFSLVLAILNGALNSIPFFGPLIAFFPIALVSLISGQPLIFLLWVAVALFTIQMLDNILLKPILISKSVSVHPATVLLAVLVGGRIAGPIGMFIAVPLFAIVQVIIVDSFHHLKSYRII